MHRRLAAHLVTLIVGVGLGVGAVAVASPAPTAQSSSDAQIVSQLRDVNKKLDVLNKSTGGFVTFAGTPSVRSLLQDIERNTTGTP